MCSYCGYLAITISNHVLLLLDIQLSTYKCNPPLWKFNSISVADKNYVTSFYILKTCFFSNYHRSIEINSIFKSFYSLLYKSQLLMDNTKMNLFSFFFIL